MLSAANGRVLWANLLFLFTLSIVPFATDWLSKTQFSVFPMNCYLILMICVTLSYILLQYLVVKNSGCQELKLIIDDSKKEAITIVLQVIALIVSFIEPIRLVAAVFLIAIFPIWLIPDLRISRLFDEKATEPRCPIEKK